MNCWQRSTISVNSRRRPYFLQYNVLLPFFLHFWAGYGSSQKTVTLKVVSVIFNAIYISLSRSKNSIRMEKNIYSAVECDVRLVEAFVEILKFVRNIEQYHSHCRVSYKVITAEIHNDKTCEKILYLTVWAISFTIVVEIVCPTSSQFAVSRRPARKSLAQPYVIQAMSTH